MRHCAGSHTQDGHKLPVNYHDSAATLGGGGVGIHTNFMLTFLQRSSNRMRPNRFTVRTVSENLVVHSNRSEFAPVIDSTAREHPSEIVDTSPSSGRSTQQGQQVRTPVSACACTRAMRLLMYPFVGRHRQRSAGWHHGAASAYGGGACVSCATCRNAARGWCGRVTPGEHGMHSACSTPTETATAVSSAASAPACAAVLQPWPSPKSAAHAAHGAVISAWRPGVEYTYSANEPQ